MDNAFEGVTRIIRIDMGKEQSRLAASARSALLPASLLVEVLYILAVLSIRLSRLTTLPKILENTFFYLTP